jgi:hypothetical protein
MNRFINPFERIYEKTEPNALLFDSRAKTRVGIDAIGGIGDTAGIHPHLVKFVS